jgi:hypothetical protein
LLLIVYLDFATSPGLSRLKNGVGLCACMICFNNESIELGKCLVAATKNFNPSNLCKHLLNHHAVEDAPNFFNASKKRPGTAACLPGGTDSFSRNTAGASTIQTFFSELSTRDVES